MSTPDVAAVQQARRRGRSVMPGLGAMALIGVLTLAPAAGASAADHTTDFSGYDLSLPDAPIGQGQTGAALGPWTGPGVTFDHDLVENSAYPSSGLSPTGRSLRISNATTQFAFLSSPPIEPAGEAGTPGVGELRTFSAQFTVASATGALQPGLVAEVALGGSDRTGGAVNLRHSDAGLEIGSFWVPADSTGTAITDWRGAVFATVDPTVPHRIGVEITFRQDQPDIVQLFVDGALVSQGSGLTTWERFHQLGGTGVTGVGQLSFRPAVSVPSPDGVGWVDLPAQPAHAGNGYLFTDISYQTTPEQDPAVPAPTDPAPVPPQPSPDPDIPLAPEEFTVEGGTVTFTASGFWPDEPVFVTFFPSGAARSPAPVSGGWFTADADGVVAAEVPIPAGIEPGQVTLQATGWFSGVTAQGTFEVPAVVAPQEPEPAPGTPPGAAPGGAAGGGQLAATGAEAAPAAVAALAAIVAGLGAHLVSRRRPVHGELSPSSQADGT